MRPRAVAQILVTVAVAAVGACRFEEPSFDGTSYACAPPDESCPPGFSCMAGRCMTVEGAPDVDAAPASDGEVDAGPVRTEMRRIEVAYDTTIRSDAPDTNEGADDLSIDASPRHVALVALALESLPPGTVVFVAKLHVTVFDPIETGTYEIYPLTESWGETTATFEEREPGVPWSTEGLSVPSLDANARLGVFAPRANGPSTVALDITQIEAWIAAPETNHGFAIVSTSPDGRGGEIRSRETAVAAERPYVTLTISSP
jgi:hypothetical protein